MSALIRAIAAPGQSIYAQIRNKSGQVWNGAAFENYNVSNWATYALSMTEQSPSGYYSVTFPSAIVADLYDFLFFNGSPATAGDNPVASGNMYWNGTEEEQGVGIVVTSSAGVNVALINGQSAPAIRLALSAGVIIPGTAAAGTLTTTQMSSNVSAPNNDFYKGRIIIWTTGTLTGQATNITGYNPTGGVFTFAAITVAPTAGDTFVIV